jgi:hypothetical protein
MPLILVTGLAGSGKTELVKCLEADLLFDDNLPGPRFLENLNVLSAALREGKRCIVVEGSLMLADWRERFLTLLATFAPGTVPEWLCFENDLAQANANCRTRLDKNPEGHVAQNERTSPLYTLPAGVVPIPVWRPAPR